jgi:hypothetical protein
MYVLKQNTFCPANAAGVMKRLMKRRTRRKSHRGSAKQRCAARDAVCLDSCAELPADKARLTLRFVIAAAMQ